MKITRLKIITEGLKRCANSTFYDCAQCPYQGTKPFPQCASLLFNEAIEVLNQQDEQIRKFRLTFNTIYGKEATEELKWNTLLTFLSKITY